jgi:hypothetical protein
MVLMIGGISGPLRAFGRLRSRSSIRTRHAIDIAGLRKDRVLLLFNGLQLADHATDLCLHFARHDLEIDRDTGNPLPPVSFGQQ